MQFLDGPHLFYGTCFLALSFSFSMRKAILLLIAVEILLPKWERSILFLRTYILQFCQQGMGKRLALSYI